MSFICNFPDLFLNFFAVRNPQSKVVTTNTPVILTAPVAAQNNVALVNADGTAKTTQAGMSGIQALAAAAAATQKITVAPQTSQIKIGKYPDFFAVRHFYFVGVYSNTEFAIARQYGDHNKASIATTGSRQTDHCSEGRRKHTKRHAAANCYFSKDQYWNDCSNFTERRKHCTEQNARRCCSPTWKEHHCKNSP